MLDTQKAKRVFTFSEYVLCVPHYMFIATRQVYIYAAADDGVVCGMHARYTHTHSQRIVHLELGKINKAERSSSSIFHFVSGRERSAWLESTRIIGRVRARAHNHFIFTLVVEIIIASRRHFNHYQQVTNQNNNKPAVLFVVGIHNREHVGGTDGRAPKKLSWY